VKISTIVMQYNGQITDRGETTSEHVRKTDVRRQLILGFDQMLNEHLPEVLHGVAKEEFPFLDDQSGLFTWQQSEPFSAMASFFIGGSLKFTWFFLTGIDTDSDRIVVAETTKFVRDMARLAGQEHALHLPAERPLALCVPWPPSPIEVHRRIVGTYAICLAIAFFEKAADIHANGEALFGKFPRRPSQWVVPGQN
jgi:hypothetical protein